MLCAIVWASELSILDIDTASYTHFVLRPERSSIPILLELAEGL